MGAAVEILEALELDFPNTVKERQKQYGLRDAYKTISWVYACTNLIADCISGVEFNLSRSSRKGDPVKLKKTDPAFTCFYPPKAGEIHTLSEMIKMQFLHLGLFGESFATLTKKGRRNITGVELFNPLMVTPKFSADGTKVEYWRVITVTASGGQKQERKIPAEDMIQWKYPNPYNPFRGLSPLTAARLAIEQDMNMATWNAGFFQNGIRNPIAMLLKQTFNPTQREEFMNRLRRNFTGFVKGQLPLLVEGGVDVKVLANTVKDLDFVEGKSLTREELCAVYNVPPAQVGIFRYANYANSREQRSILYLNNLKPKMAYYRDVFQQTVLDPYFPGVFCDFDWESVDAFREDPAIDKIQAETIKIRAEAAQILWNIGYDQKQISVAVDDENFDPSKNAPDPSLENIFDIEAARAEEEAARMAAEKEDSAEDEAEDAAEGEVEEPQPKKGFTYAKGKGVLRIYADSFTLRDYARKVQTTILNPLHLRLSKFSILYVDQVRSAEKKKTQVSDKFWSDKWRESVEPMLDSAFLDGISEVDRNLKVLRPADLRSVPVYEKFFALKTVVLGMDVEGVKRLNEAAVIHRAFTLGKMFAMEEQKVKSVYWCCAGDRHRAIHGTKTLLGKPFGDTSMSYPGEGEYELDACTCTVFPAEVVREDRVAIVKKS